MKKIVRQLLRKLGFDISRYLASNSPAAQLAKALELSGTTLVFDIGANEGQFAKEIRENGFQGSIVSFEPLTSAWKALNKAALTDKKWFVFKQSAIGDQNGEIEIHIAGNSVSSSILPMLDLHSTAAVGSAYIDSELVPISSLDAVAIPFVEQNTKLFIKIDTQGFEWQVLNGASETLKYAHGVLCELSLVPLYDGQKLWRDIIDRLDENGFMLWALQKGFTDPMTGQSLQMDGIFLRKDFVKTLK